MFKPPEPFYFKTEDGILKLFKKDSPDKGVYVDFVADAVEYDRQKLSPKKDLLARAIGLTTALEVCDLTMGLAQDAFKLAYLGAEVTAFEKHPVMFELVNDALKRADSVGAATRLQLQLGSSIQTVNVSDYSVFYLDPMYSHKRKALPKKEMQYLAELAEEDNEESFLPLIKKILGAGRRLVVKRAPQAEAFAGLKPKHSLEAKMVRFDIY